MRAWIARPGAPTVQRTTIGSLEHDARGHAHDHALAPGREAELRELVVGGEARRAGDQAAGGLRVATDEAVERVHGDAGPARGVGEDDRGLPVLLERGQGGEPVGGARGRRGGGRGRRVGRDDVPEHGGAEVHVRRVQAVRLDRQRLVREEGAAALVGEPGGLGGGEPLHEGGVEPVGQVLGSRPGRAGPRRRRGRGVGHLRHPSEPSISSFTSRLNSMAYSIGSSLVNTSRNPWMIRFWASFSVRPRLMR